jgi:hypothetical protein
MNGMNKKGKHFNSWGRHIFSESHLRRHVPSQKSVRSASSIRICVNHEKFWGQFHLHISPSFLKLKKNWTPHHYLKEVKNFTVYFLCEINDDRWMGLSCNYFFKYISTNNIRVMKKMGTVMKMKVMMNIWSFRVESVFIVIMTNMMATRAVILIMKKWWRW